VELADRDGRHAGISTRYIEIYLAAMSNTLTPTARVILGMLQLGAKTGYEIKQAVEVSTRFFWGASYGQIYPELRRLAQAGLLASSDAPRGGVRRTEYHLTAEGERVLQEWLTADDFGIFEMRDELLLRLFFADLLSGDDARAVVRRMRERSEWILERFRELEPGASDGFTEGGGERFPHLALQYGIGLMDWIARWAAETERALEEDRLS
jgi:PadR family transcriptional regulator, regulatory protein AphA